MGERSIKKKVSAFGYLYIKVTPKKLNVLNTILSEALIHKENHGDTTQRLL